MQTLTSDEALCAMCVWEWATENRDKVEHLKRLFERWGSCAVRETCLTCGAWCSSVIAAFTEAAGEGLGHWGLAWDWDGIPHIADMWVQAHEAGKAAPSVADAVAALMALCEKADDDAKANGGDA